MRQSHIKFSLLPLLLLLLLLLTYGARSFAASGMGCPDVTPLTCEEVKLLPDQLFEFDGTDGGLTDKNSVPIGFTMIDPPSTPGNPVPNADAPGYWPERLEIVGGNLVISTTAGLNYAAANSLDNALGIGLDLSEPVSLQTIMVDIPPATGGFIQAGLWFGVSSPGPSGLGGTGTAEDDYIKLIIISDAIGSWRVQALMEENGVPLSSTTDPIDASGPVTLQLELNSSLRTVTSRYCTGLNCDIAMGTVLLTFNGIPGEWFSTDQAGIDLNVGTRSMGGVMASHRNGLTPQLFSFSNFSYVSGVSVLPISSDDGIDFHTWSFTPVNKPTAMAWGPDNRLYIADVTGVVHIFTIDPDNETVLDEETVTTVENRLMLGLAIDPDSTPSDVVLWLAHSDLDQADGDANSGTVTRLSGPGFGTRQDVITGLPRAIANHATNNIHFGPDGRLYIAQGGNTGAGASNSGSSEFGPRPEQPLSAAMLVANVKDPNFDGTCTSLIDPDGSTMDATGVAARDIPCDVQVYASGLRNMYDFVFHSNGEIYGTENGLGVVGTFPDLVPTDLTWNPATGCEGMIMGSAAISEHFPGDRPDLLHRIVEGAYYGHPNPSRDECIFFGGNPTAGSDYPIPISSALTEPDYLDTDKYEVGRQPAPNWTQPLLSFGDNKSVNGVIEYNSNGAAFCGVLDGDLLFTYFSQSDQIRRVHLNSSGSSVIFDEALIRSAAGVGGDSLSNPLTMAQDPQGRIYVGEFGNNSVTVFQPINVGLWTSASLPTLPVALLDAGSTVVDNKLYAVAGKTNSGAQRTLYAFSAEDQLWTTLAELPAAYPGVENPAVAGLNGKLYVFGGATAAFSGAVNKAAVYDPATNSWTMLPDMPTARGGATAQAIGNLLYIAGGMDNDGNSVATLEIFNPATNSWSSGPDLVNARDNPGSAVFNGQMYVFGGRLRSGGTEQNGTLKSVEIYDPGTGWSAGAPMPTGRRTMNVVTYGDEILVMGGERTPEGDTFIANEAYNPATDSWRLLTNMPVGRHGAVAGLLDNVLYVGGGGIIGGTSFTADMDAFFFDCTAQFSINVYLPFITK